MQQIIIHPTYFPSISHFVALMQATEVVFEVEDNFQKQTNRNRMYIYSPNGLQLLNIPVKHATEIKQKYKDVRIENDFQWQKNHIKSLEAAYRTSPFFEYFEDDIRPLFEKKKEFLMDFNFEIMAFLQDAFGTNFKTSKTVEYLKEQPEIITDLRSLVAGKKDQNTFEPYTQVFGQKHGFLNNLSILDLLFNEGRYGLDYLREQPLKF